MHDFGKFCYLDVEKTGSSFVSEFLNTHSASKQVEHIKHGRVHKRESMADGKFFFISAREPLDQYKSLYFYGVNKRGALFSNLYRKNNPAVAFYDGTTEGFSRWLEFLLDPENAALVGRNYQPHEAKLYGLMTQRFLTLSFFRSSQALAGIDTREALTALYLKNKLQSAVIRSESLNSDLAGLVGGPLRPFIRRPEMAIGELRSTTKKVNTSARPDSSRDVVPDDGLLDRLHDREWFLFDVIGYPRQRRAAEMPAAVGEVVHTA